MGVTFRGFSIGLLSVAAIAWVVTYAESVTGKIQIGFLQLPPVVLGFLVVFILVNRLLNRISRRLPFTNAETVTIYSMMLMGAMISSRGLLEKVMPVMIATNYFANSVNEWDKLFFPFIKDWMVAYNPDGKPGQEIAVRYYEKLWAGESIPWGFWAVPCLMWGIFALFIFGAFLCLASILRRQWVDNEKLAFPLAQLPLEMMKENPQGGGVLSNKLLWIGAAIPTIVFGMNGLHNLYPNIPNVVLEYNLSMYLPPVVPWNVVFLTILYISFAGIGLFYLLPSDILFSLWAFFLIMRFQTFIAGRQGYHVESMPLYPCYSFMAYQAIGAYILLALYMLYTGWPHFKKVIGNAFGRRSVDDSEELMPHKVAVWGLVFCMVSAVVWLKFAGLDVWLGIVHLVTFIFIIGLVLGRSVSEGGLLMTETSFRPVDIVRVFTNPANLGPQNLTTMAFLDTAFLRDQRGLVLSGFLDSLKIGDGAAVRRRSFVPMFFFSIVTAAIVGGALQLYYPYLVKGANSMYGYPYIDNTQWAFRDFYQNHVRAYMTNEITPDPSMLSNRLWILFGICMTALLAYLRVIFFWWPLHPLGYALAPSWTMFNFWFPCFVAWVFKSLILRYGGMRLYLQARPFFLGLILGEFMSALLWTAISASLNSPAPQFPWP